MRRQGEAQWFWVVDFKAVFMNIYAVGGIFMGVR